MNYVVTYLIGGKQRTDRLAARDAAAAAALCESRRRIEGSFELLSVVLLGEPQSLRRMVSAQGLTDGPS